MLRSSSNKDRSKHRPTTNLSKRKLITGWPAQPPVTIKRSRLIFSESRIAKKKKARHQRRQTSNATSKRLYRQNSKRKRKSQALLVLKEKFSRSWCLINLSCYPKYESYLLTLSKAFANKKRRGKHLSLLRLSNNTKLKKFTRNQHLAA